MKQSKRMAKTVTKLLKSAGVSLDEFEPGSALRIEDESETFEPLIIERLTENRWSVAHYYVEYGDSCADPDVEFYGIIRDGQLMLFPFAIQNSWGYKNYAKFENGFDKAPSHLDYSGQADLSSFCAIWAQNIARQGWYKRAANEFETKLTLNK